MFLHSRSQELNPMLRVKKQVNRLMRRSFRDEMETGIGQTKSGNELYEALSSQLTKIQALLGEIVMITEVGHQGSHQQRAIKVREHSLPIMSSLLNATKALERYMTNMTSLQSLTQLQYSDIKNSINTIEGYNNELRGLLPNFGLFTEYQAVFNGIFQRLRGYLMSTVGTAAGFEGIGEEDDDAASVNSDHSNHGNGNGGNDSDDDDGNDDGNDGNHQALAPFEEDDEDPDVDGLIHQMEELNVDYQPLPRPPRPSADDIALAAAQQERQRYFANLNRASQPLRDYQPLGHYPIVELNGNVNPFLAAIAPAPAPSRKSGRYSGAPSAEPHQGRRVKKKSKKD